MGRTKVVGGGISCRATQRACTAVLLALNISLCAMSGLLKRADVGRARQCTGVVDRGGSSTMQLVSGGLWAPVCVAGGMAVGSAGRPIELHMGGLTGKMRSLCLSYCISKGHDCRFLGLCLVPRGKTVTGTRGRTALRTTGTVGVAHVLRVAGGGTNLGGASLGTGRALTS